MSLATVLSNLKADVESAIASFTGDRQPPAELLEVYANLTGAIASSGVPSPSELVTLDNSDASSSSATLIKWKPPAGKRWQVLYMQGALSSSTAASVACGITYSGATIAYQVCPGTASTGNDLAFAFSVGAIAINAAKQSSAPVPSIADGLTSDYEIGMSATAGTLSTLIAQLVVIERDA